MPPTFISISSFTAFAYASLIDLRGYVLTLRIIAPISLKSSELYLVYLSGIIDESSNYKKYPAYPAVLGFTRNTDAWAC